MRLSFLLSGLFLFSCATIPQAPEPSPQEVLEALIPNALEMAGYGGYERPIIVSISDSTAPQDWFNRGLQLVYGFNHDAAVYSFAKAAEADPDCAMAWWGIAHAYGVDVNNPEVTETEAVYAKVAIQEALRIVEKGSTDPIEKSLIQAAAYRAISPLPKNRSYIDQAYSDALGRAWSVHMNDPDVGTLYAESLMNMQAWNYWSPEGEPVQNTEIVLSTLESVLSLHPTHPGANHFYIHAIEASKVPEKGVPSAERLEGLVPGSGHLVHMPSHIYINVGRYSDAVAANQRAIKADEAYFNVAGYPTFYRVYFLHNMHFLMYAAMMTGQKEIALNAVNKMESQIPPGMLESMAKQADALASARIHVYMRFGMWKELLALPEYEDYRLLSRALRAYTRTIAFANLKQVDNARSELDRFHSLRKDVPEDWIVGLSPADAILSVAAKVAEGEVLWREGKTEEALVALREAVKEEDQLLYAEPPGWMIPVRHALGAILLAAKQPTEAQSVYETDLEEHPGNAWSLLGMTQSLRMQNKEKQADTYEAKFKKAWRSAGFSPPASCYCGV